MENVYFYAAVIGGAFLVVQTLFLVFAGGGHDMDSSLDVDPSDVTDGHGLDHADTAQAAFLKILSLKTLVGFATFFTDPGLGGRAAG